MIGTAQLHIKRQLSWIGRIGTSQFRCSDGKASPRPLRCRHSRWGDALGQAVEPLI